MSFKLNGISLTSNQLNFRLWFCFAVAAYSIIFFHANYVFASEYGDSIDEQTRTAYLKADFGLITYKSKLLLSNDTGSEFGYDIGAHVGETKHFGINIRKESSSIKFPLVDGSLKTSLQDTTVRYRMGFFYLGGIISSSSMAAISASDVLFDASGNGFGANFGFLIAISRSAILFLDVKSVNISQTLDKEQKDVKLGSRTDIDLGSSIGITKKALYLIFGYRERSNSIAYNGSKEAEIRTSTYLGFQLGGDF